MILLPIAYIAYKKYVKFKQNKRLKKALKRLNITPLHTDTYINVVMSEHIKSDNFKSVLKSLEMCEESDTGMIIKFQEVPSVNFKIALNWLGMHLIQRNESDTKYVIFWDEGANYIDYYENAPKESN